jgi:hypothetical protein
MARINYEISDDKHRALKIKCAQLGKTIKEVLDEFINEFTRK